MSRLLVEISFRHQAAVVAAEIAAMPAPSDVAIVLEGLQMPTLS